MRGWALLDDFPFGLHANGLSLVLHSAAREPRDRDIIAFAPDVGMALRPGTARVAKAERFGRGWRLRFAAPITESVPLATSYDAIYVAVAIGEHAFSRAS
jgi:hypothetical protein